MIVCYDLNTQIVRRFKILINVVMGRLDGDRTPVTTPTFVILKHDEPDV